MKTQRRFLSGLLALLMVASLFAAIPFTVSAATAKYVKVTEEPADWSGDYLIVYEDGGKAFKGSLSGDSLNQANNFITVTISDGEIESNADTDAAKVTIAACDGGYSIKTSGGSYISGSNGSNALNANSAAQANSISLTGGSAHIVSNTSVFRFNTGWPGFRYYKSDKYTNQKAVQLYKLTEAAAPVTYTITWKLDANTVIDTTSVAYGTVPTHEDAVKTEDDDYTYTFEGWDTEPVAVTGEATYTAVFTAVPKVHTYTVTWNNWNGVALEIDTGVAAGETPVYNGAEPTKDADATYSYVFAGWTPEIEEVTGDITYTATFMAVYQVNVKTLTGTTTYTVYISSEMTVPQLKEAVAVETGIPAASQRLIYAGKQLANDKTVADYNIQEGKTIHLVPVSYTITWKLDEDTVIDTTTVAYGNVPTHEDAVKAEDDDYTYTFEGWDPEVVAVTGDATYTAVFTAVPKVTNSLLTIIDGENGHYEIAGGYLGNPDAVSSDPVVIIASDVVVDADAVLNVAENAKVVFDGEAKLTSRGEISFYPRSANTAVITAVPDDSNYEFDGWYIGDELYSTDAVLEYRNFTESTVLTAKFKVKTYNVTWKNYDGTILETDVVPYTDVPTYDGATPEKPSDVAYRYAFSGWSFSYSVETASVVYTAKFAPVARAYIVTWKNPDGTILEYDYGVAPYTIPSYDGEEPTMTGAPGYIYVFTGWDSEISKVTKDVVYTAVYDEYAVYMGAAADSSKTRADIYFYIPEDADPAEYTVKINGDDEVSLDSVTPDENGYQFSITSPAKNMGDKISYSFKHNGVEIKSGEVSVADYARNLALIYPDYADFANAMLAYGAAAQNHFGYDTEHLVSDADLSALAPVPGERFNSTYILSAMKANADIPATYTAMNVTFLADTTFSLAFRVKGGVSDAQAIAWFNENVTFGGEPVSAEISYSTTSDLRFVVINKQNIAITDIDEPIEFVINGAGTHYFSVMNYLAAVEKTGTDSIKALTRALYAYSLAAQELN